MPKQRDNKNKTHAETILESSNNGEFISCMAGKGNEQLQRIRERKRRKEKHKHDCDFQEDFVSA